MEALTVSAITNTISEVHSNLPVHSATIAYIQILLTPYAQALEAARTVQDITAWVPLAFPGRLGREALNSMNTNIADSEREDADMNADPLVVNTAKSEVIEYIVSEIKGLSGQFRSIDDIILPWDVQRSIGNDEELATLFGIVRGTNTLPVTVTVGPQSFQHMLTEEFTMGLLLFSIVANVDFHITMFGFPITRDNFLLEDGTYLPSQYKYIFNVNHRQYKVTVGITEYTFQTGDFMQGFHTGSIWAGVDHHNYWSDLMVIQAGEWTAITF